MIGRGSLCDEYIPSWCGTALMDYTQILLLLFTFPSLKFPAAVKVLARLMELGRPFPEVVCLVIFKYTFSLLLPD